jgi:hypothetical protein
MTKCLKLRTLPHAVSFAEVTGGPHSCKQAAGSREDLLGSLCTDEYRAWEEHPVEYLEPHHFYLKLQQTAMKYQHIAGISNSQSIFQHTTATFDIKHLSDITLFME